MVDIHCISASKVWETGGEGGEKGDKIDYLVALFVVETCCPCNSEVGLPTSSMHDGESFFETVRKICTTV